MSDDEHSAELDRLHGRLSRIAELHTKWAPSPYRSASCAECRESWPCATHRLATSPDLPGDQACADAHARRVAGEPTSTDHGRRTSGDGDE